MEQSNVLSSLTSEVNCKYLDAISQIHMFTKHYLLIAEELSEDGVTFLQPMKEHRDAYDHLMRIFFLPFKEVIVSDDTEHYIKNNLEKALGHEYRAFFDTADWLTFICRKKIRECLIGRRIQLKYKEKFEDFSSVVELINSLPLKIAKYREDKDISKNNRLEDVITYKDTIDRLLEIYQRVITLEFS